LRALIQRVSSASVTIEGQVNGKIGEGIVLFLGICHADTEADCDFLAEKCANLRIFKDAEDKMNLSLLDIKGGVLIISQFTLYGDCRKGRRPGFSDAARPDQAIPLYERFIEKIKSFGVEVGTGEFGAMMDVEIHNHGPVTFMVESQ
jgi:D-tyrosyl-tRNA(Tyr) deacylase